MQQHDYQHMLIEDLQAKNNNYCLLILILENILTEGPVTTFLNSSKSVGLNC